MISQITPAGVSPASRARSTRGLGLPGAHQHAAFARAQREHVARTRQIRRAGSRDRSTCRMVRVRSAAEMPVVTPSRASIDSQNAVPKIDVFVGLISGSRR